MNYDSLNALRKVWAPQFAKAKTPKELAVLVSDAMNAAYEQGWKDALEHQKQIATIPLNGDRWENEGGR